MQYICPGLARHPGHCYANTPISYQDAQCKRGFLGEYRTSSRGESAYLPAGAGAAGAAAGAAEAPASTQAFFPASQTFPASPKLRSYNTSFQTSSSDSLLFHPFIFVLGTPSAIRHAHTESE